jgi:hypothetical protein
VIVVIACALATVPAVSGRAATWKHKPPRPATFQGNCDFSGTVTLTPGMTNTPQSVAQHASAAGTCTGTFSDRRGRTSSLDRAPAIYKADSAGDHVSCLAGTATGAGTLSFAGGALAFAFSETRLVATPLLKLTGKAGGEMDGFTTPSQSQDPVASVQACNGSGLESLAFDAHFQTTSPISG